MDRSRYDITDQKNYNKRMKMQSISQCALPLNLLKDGESMRNLNSLNETIVADSKRETKLNSLTDEKKK